MGTGRKPAEAAEPAALDPSPGGAELDAAEIRTRAAGGAATLGARGLVVMALGVGANIYLARELGTEGFGIAALGMTMVLLGQFLSAGLGAALIRRDDPPDEAELASALGYQLIGSIGFVAAAAAAGHALTEDGPLIALMLLAVPVAVVRMPAYVLLERQLSYRLIATVDIAEGLFFYAWAVIGVAAGAGVWAFATAVLARALLGSLLMSKLGPFGFMRPRFDWSRTKPIMSFGVRYQAATAGGVARDQGINIGIAAIAGLDALGVWSLANRILQIPLLAMRAMLRVAYPAMSRLAEGGGSQAAAIERGTGVVAVAVAFLLVAIAAGAPAGIPPLLGSEWDSAPAILVLSCAGLMLAIPVATAATGYLFAAGRPGIVAVCAACEALAAAAITLPLLPVIGIESVGLAWPAIAVVDLLILARAASRDTGARILGAVGGPFLIATLAGGLAVLISTSGEPSLWLAAGAACVGVAILTIAFLLLRRDLLVETLRLAKTGFGGLRVRDPEPPRG